VFWLDDKTEKRLETLKKEGQESRRRTEKIGGIVLAVASLLVAAMFLWILAMSHKRPYTIMITLAIVAGSVTAFAWGLKMIYFGKRV